MPLGKQRLFTQVSGHRSKEYILEGKEKRRCLHAGKVIYVPGTDVLTRHPLSTRLWWKGPRLPGSYWASSAQGFMAVMEMLCPLHLKTPASHSDIVSSLPFTSTQMLYPASWHSEASLQTHLLFWAGRASGRDLMAHCECGRLKAHHLQTNGMLIREPLLWVRQ